MSLTPDQVTAVVLAGGFGARIQHLLPNLPKPMAPVCGKPFLEWVVRYLVGQDVRRIILSTGHLAGTIESHFHSMPVKSSFVTCVPETKPLGTAGGFLNALHGDPAKPAAWLVLNGDSLALAALAEMFQLLDAPQIEGAILGVPMSNATRYGTVLQDHKGDLAGFQEKRPGQGVINAGVYLFRAAAVESFPRREPLSFETDVFPALVSRGARLTVCVTQAPFLDIGTPESLPLAEKFIAQHAGFFPAD